MNIAYPAVYNRDLPIYKGLNYLIGIMFFVIVTMLGAYIRIPVPGSPVPITFQTFFVLLSGAVLGKRLGSASQIAYISLGLIGAPVFQSFSSGSAYLLGPTGGYLFGFVLASFTVGRLIVSRQCSLSWAVFCFALGSLIICSFGSLWLSFIYGMNITNAISVGFLPFIPGDMVKIFLAAFIYLKISGRSRQIFPN